MSRSAALLVALLGALCLACGSGGSKDQPEALAPLGYGPADTCHLLSADFVDQVANAGLRFVVCEALPSVQAADWRKGQVPVSFPDHMREWSRRVCDNGQTLVLFLVNWNMEPLRDQPDEWFVNLLNQTLSVYDPACTWLEPIVEPDEGTREQLQKAQRWAQLAADAWPGKLLLPAAGAHWPVRRDWVDWHPSSPEDLLRFLDSPPPGWLVVTDGGSFTSPPTVFGEYETLSRRALEAKVPVVFYADRWQGPHEPVIAEIGKAVR